MAAGVGLMTCIRVCDSESQHVVSSPCDTRISQHTFNKSMGYMTECSATPAKAPAAMLAARLKFGGKPS
jgi:hypothetical protein